MITNIRFKSFFCIFILSAQVLDSKVIIFDLGGVLFATSKWTVVQEIGLWNLIAYKMHGGDPQTDSFHFLDTILGKQMPHNPSAPQKAWLYTMGNGNRLPKIWCDHMKGTLSGKQVIEQVENHLHKQSKKKKRFKDMVKRFINTVFNPKTLVQATYPIAEGVQLVADCAKKTANKIMVLSNYGADCFDELYKKPESKAIFDHIPEENLMISGKMGLLKPDPAIYQEVKSRLMSMDERFADPIFLATNCVFIDDQMENILGARQAGITSLSLTDGDYNRIRKELELFGAL